MVNTFKSMLANKCFHQSLIFVSVYFIILNTFVKFLTIHRPQLDQLVITTTQHLVLWGYNKTTTHSIMSSETGSFLPRCQVPILDYTVTTSTCKLISRVEVLCKYINSISMAITKLADKWLSKHPFKFGSLKCPSVFSGPFKWM